jgi:methylenetetrahydrofolate dehydrogenase (NADP+)/methenyltetrahydrofolate cyclohydrolase
MPNSAEAQIKDGTTLARRLLDDMSERSLRFAVEIGRPPCLAAVLVGEDPASIRYVKMKRSRCEDAGLDSRLIQLPTTSTTA